MTIEQGRSEGHDSHEDELRAKIVETVVFPEEISGAQDDVAQEVYVSALVIKVKALRAATHPATATYVNSLDHDLSLMTDILRKKRPLEGDKKWQEGIPSSLPTWSATTEKTAKEIFSAETNGNGNGSNGNGTNGNGTGNGNGGNH